MADDIGQDKSELATPHRLDEARRKGQIAVSSEFNSALSLLVSALFLWGGSGYFGVQVARLLRGYLGEIGRHRDWGYNETLAALTDIIHQATALSASVLLTLFVLSLLAGLLQAGFNISFTPLMPDWERLSIVKGWSRLFSMRAVMRLVMAIFKISAVSSLVVWIVAQELERITASGQHSFKSVLEIGWEISIHLALAVAGVLIVLGAFDLLFQRWKHGQDLMMSKQDIRDEQKNEDGDPMLKARIRRLQREVAQRRMLQEVKTATAVTVNPTHFAVAIRYDKDVAAPIVVAKGADHLAKKIVAIARAHGVPVLERKPLTRALYKMVNVGQEIPVELYQAVAEILVYLFNLKRSA